MTAAPRRDARYPCEGGTVPVGGLRWIPLALWGYGQPHAVAPCLQVNGSHPRPVNAYMRTKCREVRSDILRSDGCARLGDRTGPGSDGSPRRRPECPERLDQPRRLPGLRDGALAGRGRIEYLWKLQQRRRAARGHVLRAEEQPWRLPWGSVQFRRTSDDRQQGVLACQLPSTDPPCFPLCRRRRSAWATSFRSVTCTPSASSLPRRAVSRFAVRCICWTT